MIFYDGHSDINWFYDGIMTFDQMKNTAKYKEVTEVPVVLRDNGAGKVYGYERADKYAMRNGELLDPNDPEATIQKIFDKQAGLWLDPLEVLARILMRSNFSDEDARDVKDFYPEWKIGVSYKQDWVILYNDNLYRIAQDHVSQEQWKPGEVGTESLYSSISLNSSGYEIWKQPTGAHDAYNIGDIVEYKDTLYQSLVDGNVWAPDTYSAGWKEYDASTSTEPSTPDPGTETPTEPDYPDFVQPTGAHDAYKKGDIVKYNGTLYKSLIDGNVYSPDAYPQGWEVYTEE